MGRRWLALLRRICDSSGTRYFEIHSPCGTAGLGGYSPRRWRDNPNIGFAQPGCAESPVEPSRHLVLRWAESSVDDTRDRSDSCVRRDPRDRAGLNSLARGKSGNPDCRRSDVVSWARQHRDAERASLAAGRSWRALARPVQHISSLRHGMRRWSRRRNCRCRLRCACRGIVGTMR